MKAANDTPRLSIGMPVHNGERYVETALRSLLQQRFQDYELIVSNNGSTDATKQIVERVMRHDPRARLVNHQALMRPEENFLYCLSQARGQYFMWAAHDDKWHPAFTERLVEALDLHPKVALAFATYQHMNEADEPLGDPIDLDYSGRTVYERLCRFSWTYRDTCTYGIFRRSVMEGIQFPRWRWMNRDIPTNTAYPILYRVLAQGDFALVRGEPLWYYRTHTGHAHARSAHPGRPVLNFAAFAVRKANVAIESLRYVYRGSGSAGLSLAVWPILQARCAYDTLAELKRGVALRLVR